MENQSIKMLDCIIINEAVPDKKIRKGAIGTVVEILAEGHFLIEFSDRKGHEYAMLALRADQVVKVEFEPALSN